MKSQHRWFWILPAALPLLVAAAEPLNVKLGLWEISSETRMTGLPPLPKELLDQMSAEQRATLQAAIKSQTGGEPLRDTSKQCVTREDLENPFNDDELKNCERTVVSSSSTRQEFRLVCTGERAGEGTFRINTPTPESMTGEFELKVANGADTMTITSRMQGKWLGADCRDE